VGAMVRPASACTLIDSPPLNAFSCARGRRLHLRLARDVDAGLDEAAAEDARAARHAAAEAALRSAVMVILRAANERKEHIPPVVSGGVVSFPFDIALPPEEGGYGVDALKRLVTAARPPVNVL